MKVEACPAVRRMKDLEKALKKLVEGRKEALEWVAGLLEDEAEEREGEEEEEGEDIPILPLTESVVNCDFQVVLEQCGLTKTLAGEQCWWIPGPVTAEVLKTWVALQ